LDASEKRKRDVKQITGGPDEGPVNVLPIFIHSFIHSFVSDEQQLGGMFLVFPREIDFMPYA
jgi:hypothetical protein